MSKDYYKILGVSKTATADEIKKAFRKLAHQYHPDKGKGNEAKFKDVNEAYQVLKDDKKRQQYDQFGSASNQAGFAGGQNPFSGFDFSQGYQGQTGFSDIDIDEIFGDFFGNFRRSNGGGRQQTKRGQDLEINLTVNFQEAALGIVKKVKITREVVCQTCQGSGAKNDQAVEKCKACAGSGRQTYVRQTFLGNIQTQSVCNECRGEGNIIKDKCTSCRGSGKQTEEKFLDIDVPGGIENGQRLRMQGEGSVGQRRGQAGDLYVNIRVTPDSKFDREGEKIFSEQKVSFSLMSLGGKTLVKVVDGTVSLKIPAGTQSGEQFRLRGKGAKRLGSARRGDHLVTIKVAVPNKMTAVQKGLLKDLEDQGL